MRSFRQVFKRWRKGVARGNMVTAAILLVIALLAGAADLIAAAVEAPAIGVLLGYLAMIAFICAVAFFVFATVVKICHVFYRGYRWIALRTNLLPCHCSRCSKPFPFGRNRGGEYARHGDVLKWLAPYHKDFQQWSYMCPECFKACMASINEVRARVSQWRGSTKGEFIHDYKTVKTLGRVDYKGTECDEPEKVEKLLQLYAAQLGGNACVKSFWEKCEERHSDRVLAGYSRNDNPYYRTEFRTTRWFTGYATAVLVEPFSKQRAPAVKMADGPINHKVKHIVLDGLNICHWASRDETDLRILLAIVLKLAQQRLPFLTFFDANTPHVLRERDAVAYKRLVGELPRIFVEVPGKIRADEFILQRANSDNAHVISNDQFRDFADRYPWVSAGDRLIKGTVAGNRVLVPQLDCDLRIKKDAAGVADELVKAIAHD